MAKLTFQAALERLDKGPVDQLLLLVGDNYYQSFLLTELVSKRKLPSGQRAYNRHLISGEKASPSVLEERLFSVPLLGGNVVVVLTDLQRLPAKSHDFLLKALKRLDPSVTFVGVARKLDMRTTFAKSVATVSTVIELKEIYADKLPGYVRSRFAVRGLSLDEAAVREFCRVVGNDCGEIENEADKIAINAVGKGSLTHVDISAYLSSSRHFDRYNVANFLGNKELTNTLLSLRRVLDESPSEAAGLFWAIEQQLERILLYKQLSPVLKPIDLAGRLKMSPFFLEDLKSQVEKHRAEEIVNALLEKYRAERDSRFTGEPMDQILERMVIKILTELGE